MTHVADRTDQTTGGGLSGEDLDTLAKRWLALEVKRKQVAQEQDGIKARLRHALSEGSHDTASGARVTVSPNRRFDPTVAEQVLPAELRSVVEVTVIDAKKAKQVLPPGLYQACTTPAGEPKVAIR